MRLFAYYLTKNGAPSEKSISLNVFPLQHFGGFCPEAGGQTWDAGHSFNRRRFVLPESEKSAELLLLFLNKRRTLELNLLSCLSPILTPKSKRIHPGAFGAGDKVLLIFM